jgi:hypothetical protein
MEAVLDYYNRQPQVSLGSPAPQLDPKLLQAIQTAPPKAQAAPPPEPQQDVAAKEQQLVRQAMQEQAAMYQQQQQAAGLGVQLKPDGDRPQLFPYDEYNQQRDEIAKKRMEAYAKVNKYLARPDIIVQPEHVIKNARLAYDSDINQKYPEKPEFEKARPEVVDLTKEMQQNVLKRMGHISKLASQIAFTDYGKKPGESDKDWLERASTTLKSQLKIYNTALVGTSDALSNQERSSLSPELNEWMFEPKSWFRVGGESAFKSNVEGFKQKMMVLHDIIVNEVNDGYNIVAGQTSPDYANRSFGFAQFSPYQTIPYTPRIDKTAPREVIGGSQPMAQAYFQKKANMEETANKYYGMMEQMINEQKVNPDVAKQIFSKKYMQDFGVKLPEKTKQAEPPQKSKK